MNLFSWDRGPNNRLKKVNKNCIIFPCWDFYNPNKTKSKIKPRLSRFFYI
ncbi:hypothetical protein XBFFL1_1840025 [Xenorhabdus bovienii str. feltiae Florida]|nr:hypothetical protein XBFFR1_2020035 [Xenorhabdus bovienii str. feltiae France]CDG91818.1 hypothetical protein XBFFL1_1840025 [Xenorhabdus bovienii str. feltiae Florida]